MYTAQLIHKALHTDIDERENTWEKCCSAFAYNWLTIVLCVRPCTDIRLPYRRDQRAMELIHKHFLCMLFCFHLMVLVSLSDRYNTPVHRVGALTWLFIICCRIILHLTLCVRFFFVVLSHRRIHIFVSFNFFWWIYRILCVLSFFFFFFKFRCTWSIKSELKQLIRQQC